LLVILQRLDNEPPLFFWDEVQGFPEGTLGRLIDIRVLREITASPTAVCWGCGGGHVGHVEFIANNRTGDRHAYIPCPQCGPVEVPPEHLKRWIVDIPGFLETLSTAGEIRGPCGELVPGHLWRLGVARWGRRPREVFFARHVDDDNVLLILTELASRPKTVLLMPTEAGSRICRRDSLNLILALESVLSLGPTALALNQPFVESQLVDAGYIKTSEATRPSRKRSERAAKIEKLTGEMIQHLRAAKDHALSTQEQTGVPKLLARPTQKQLAKQTRMSESDVSRCLADQAARELRLYWDTADDLEQIMKWESRRSRGNRE
jgi:hypothetical protein